MSRTFLDSNVLIYSIDLADDRRAIAQNLLSVGAKISAQCLNEFALVARRKLGLTWDKVEQARDDILALCDPVLPVTLETHRLGLALAQHYRLSIYDGMVVAAALIADCDLLCSEDMHHGLIIDGRLRIENPFVA